MAVLQPSSACAERAFSTLNLYFNYAQERALQDIVETTVMLQFNKCEVYIGQAQRARTSELNADSVCMYVCMYVCLYVINRPVNAHASPRKAATVDFFIQLHLHLPSGLP